MAREQRPGTAKASGCVPEIWPSKRFSDKTVSSLAGILLAQSASGIVAALGLVENGRSPKPPQAAGHIHSIDP